TTSASSNLAADQSISDSLIEKLSAASSASRAASGGGAATAFFPAGGAAFRRAPARAVVRALALFRLGGALAAAFLVFSSGSFAATLAVVFGDGAADLAAVLF